jgi:hypothetical protein
MNVFSKDELNKLFKQVCRISKHNGKFINTFLSVDDEEYGTGEKINKNIFLIDNSKQLVKFFKEREIRNLYERNGFNLTLIHKREEKRKICNKLLDSKYYLAIGKKSVENL